MHASDSLGAREDEAVSVLLVTLPPFPARLYDDMLQLQLCHTVA